MEKQDRMYLHQHDAALITLVRHAELREEFQHRMAAEKAKKVHYTRHAQVGFDGCDPETCQNKEHWFYETDDYDAVTKFDPTPITMDIIERHGLREEYEKVLKERMVMFEKLRAVK